MEFRVEEMPNRRVAYIHHVGPYMNVGDIWTKLLGWAGSSGVFTPETLSIGVSYDDPGVVPEEELRYDACVTIPEDFSVGDDSPVSVQMLDGGRFGIAMHKGHYAGLQDFYPALHQSLIDAGEKIRPRACWEIYVNSPMDVDPDELLTEIYIPVH